MNEAAHNIVVSEHTDSMGDFSIDEELGDIEGIYVPQKGINMPTSDKNLSNPSKLKLKDNN